MTDTLLVALSHPDTLSSGRPIAPGDQIPADALDPEDLHDAQLIADGAFVAIKGKGEKATVVELDEQLAAAAAATVQAGVATPPAGAGDAVDETDAAAAADPAQSTGGQTTTTGDPDGSK